MVTKKSLFFVLIASFVVMHAAENVESTTATKAEIYKYFQNALDAKDQETFENNLLKLSELIKSRPNLTMMAPTTGRMVGASSGITPLKLAIFKVPTLVKPEDVEDAGYFYTGTLLQNGADPLFNPYSALVTPKQFQYSPLVIAIENKNPGALKALIEDPRVSKEDLRKLKTNTISFFGQYEDKNFKIQDPIVKRLQELLEEGIQRK